MSLTKLPVTVGGVDFEITPFVEHGGVRSLGETKTFNAICDGSTVTIK